MRLKDEFEKLDIGLDKLFYKRVEQYIKFLQQWGKIHNLTASLDYNDIEDNIFDSLYPLQFINNFNSIADVGTGAGYPGMIIAIAKPNIKTTLIEPRVKRVAFLKFIKSALKLENLEIIEDRVENVKDKVFDLITSRAVTNTKLLLNLTGNISNYGTQYLFYKGSLCEDEIEEAKVQNYLIEKRGTKRNYLYIKNRG